MHTISRPYELPKTKMEEQHEQKAGQYLELLLAAVAYYVLHEGAHLIYAPAMAHFKRIHFLGLGMQIDVYTEQMTDVQIDFCLIGATATLRAAWPLTAFCKRICKVKSPAFRAPAYYIAIAILFADPLYLSVLRGFFGGGDMNGISLLLPEAAAKILFAVLDLLHAFVFVKRILPAYQASFRENTAQ